MREVTRHPVTSRQWWGFLSWELRAWIQPLVWSCSPGWRSEPDLEAHKDRIDRIEWDTDTMTTNKPTPHYNTLKTSLNVSVYSEKTTKKTPKTMKEKQNTFEGAGRSAILNKRPLTWIQALIYSSLTVQFLMLYMLWICRLLHVFSLQVWNYMTHDTGCRKQNVAAWRWNTEYFNPWCPSQGAVKHITFPHPCFDMMSLYLLDIYC